MLDKCASGLADLLSAHQIVKTEDKDIYAYGLEVLLSTLVNSTILVILGLLLGLFPETLIFIGAYGAMRVFTGGYHARTHLGCIATFTAIYLTSMVLVRYTPDVLRTWPALLISLVCLVYIWIVAPVEHVNRPFEGKEYERFKKAGRVVALAETSLCFLNHWIFQLHPDLSFLIALAMLSVVFVLAIAKIIK